MFVLILGLDIQFIGPLVIISTCPLNMNILQGLIKFHQWLKTLRKQSVKEGQMERQMDVKTVYLPRNTVYWGNKELL